jgi:hypothetical protein
MGGTMNRYAFPFRVVGLVGMVVLLALLVVRPVGAFPSLYQATDEPTPRPTATSAPFLELNPTRGVAGDATSVQARGMFWTPGQQVRLYWDEEGASRRLGTADVGGDGTFQFTFTTPTDPALAWVGTHTVIAVGGGLTARATFELVRPTPTFTPTPTHNRPPTDTPRPPTPITPSPTPTTTYTPIPEPTLRPITPMVTISPIPPTSAPIVTRAPQPTRTNTPVPGTPTNTRTPSVTPTPSNTPGPGTPSATPQPTATSTAEMAETGSRAGMIFLWGFVLAALLVVFRLLRVRSLPR